MVGPLATEPTLGIKVLSAGSAACVADAITFPLDVAKVRLQIQGENVSSLSTLLMNNAAAVKYRGVIGTVVTITKQEGFLSLYNGLCAGLQRQMCFASVRIGLYDSVKAKYVAILGKKYATDKAGQANIAVRILAGISTGGMSVICAQPTDVVKVRMQAQKSNEPRRYNGALHAYKTIGRQEGMAGLWKVIYRQKAGSMHCNNKGELIFLKGKLREFQRKHGGLHLV